MDLNLLTIARRANLGDKIKRAFENANQRIDQIESITDKIGTSNDFETKERVQSREFAIIGIVSITEQLLNEVLHHVLISHPKKFGNKKFEVDELIEEGSILELFYKKANQKLLDLAYGKFDTFISNFKGTLELTREIDSSLVLIINEIKCTRDCLLHSEGKASELYFSKVGDKARARSINEKLTIDTAYYKASVDNIRQFLSDILASVPSKITDSKRAYIFKQMWEATCLEKRISFSTAWTIVDANLVRPTDISEEFGFSSSEMEVYNLFRHIYNHSSFKVDFAFYFQRWKPQSNEHQIATSWLDNQFYF